MRQLQVGRPPVYAGKDEYLKAMSDWIAQLAALLEEYSFENDRPVSEPYSVENVTLTRTLDADSTSTDELADILGTLLTDLKGKVLK